MERWTEEDSAAVQAEGWDVFLVDGHDAQPEIERCDELELLESDDEAIAFVERKALEGSALHQKALRLHRSWDHGLAEADETWSATAKLKRPEPSL